MSYTNEHGNPLSPVTIEAARRAEGLKGVYVETVNVVCTTAEIAEVIALGLRHDPNILSYRVIYTVANWQRERLVDVTTGRVVE